jgi:hypothetical protein
MEPSQHCVRRTADEAERYVAESSPADLCLTSLPFEMATNLRATDAQRERWAERRRLRTKGSDVRANVAECVSVQINKKVSEAERVGLSWLKRL